MTRLASSILILSLCLLLWSSALAQQPPKAEFSVSDGITGSTEVEHNVTLAGPANFLIHVDQDSIDLQLWVSPGGRDRIVVNSITGHFGDEYLAFNLPASADITVGLSAPEQTGISGRYDLHIEQVHDDKVWQGLKLLTEAGTLGVNRADANRRASLSLLSEAADIFAQAGDDALQAHARHQAGFNYYWLLQIDASEEQYVAASVLYKKLGDDIMYNIVLVDIAASIMEAQRFADAEDLYRAAINDLIVLGDTFAEAYARNNFGLMNLYVGALDFAEEQFVLAKHQYAKHANRAKAAQANANIALVYDRRGELRRSRDIYQASLEMVSAEDNQWLRAIFLTNLASVERRLGNVNRALVLLGDAKDSQEAADDVAGLAWTLSGIANIYRNISRPHDALRFQQQSVELRISRDESGGLADALLRLGDDYREVSLKESNRDRLRLAVENHQASLEVAPNRRQQAVAKLALARDYIASGDFSQASESLQQARAAAEESGDNGLLIDISLAFAKIPASVTGTIEQDLRRALQDAHANQDKTRLANASAALARVTGDKEEALRLNRQALSVLADERRRVANPWLQTHLTNYEYPVVAELLEAFLSVESDDGRVGEALQLVLEYRARALTALLQELEQPMQGGVSEQLSDELQQAQEIYRETLALQRPQTASRPIDLALADIEIARARIYQAKPQYGELVFSNAVTVDELQNGLRGRSKSQTALLLYFVGARKSYGWMITGDSVESWEMPGEVELHNSIAALTDAIVNLNLISAIELNRRTSEVSAYLLPPADSLTGINHIIIAPDGSIGAAPFAALFVGSGDDERYLIEQAAITFAPTLSSISKPLISQLNEVAPTVVADRDRYLAFEAAAADEEHSPYAFIDTANLGDKALTPFIKGKDILHFAGHAWVDPLSPSLSGIELQLSESVARRLTLAEIYELEIDASLVFLGACETGLGEAIRGEGAQNLVRGFLYAGAQSVISTNWRVDERHTALFSALFYSTLEGEGDFEPTKALRETQLKMLKEMRESRHPYYWAGYSLVR